MNSQSLFSLSIFYGVFLIICGIASVIFIGRKAKTALISGGTSGLISCAIAYFLLQNAAWAAIAGMCLTVALFIVFCWRSCKTLFKIFELIPAQKSTEELNGKGIAFLIISLMAIVSIFVFILQMVIFTKLSDNY